MTIRFRNAFVRRYKIVIQYYFSVIESFFFTLVKNKINPIYNLNLIINPTDYEQVKDSILMCKPVKDTNPNYRIHIVKIDQWPGTSQRFVLVVKNVLNKIQIINLLREKLEIKMIEPPNNLKKMVVNESHIPF